MASKVFSGRKSSVMVRLDVTPAVDSKEKTVGKAYKVATTSTDELEYQIYLGKTKGDVSGAEQENFSHIKKGQGFITTKDNKTYVDIIIPSLSKLTLNNGGDVTSWSSFGSVYKDKLPTILEWSGSLSGKVDFGDNPAQIILYQAMIGQERLEMYFYLKTLLNENKELLESKTVVFKGNAYIKSYNVDTDPENVADVSIDFEGDNELSLINAGVEISADWSQILIDDGSDDQPKSGE